MQIETLRVADALPSAGLGVGGSRGAENPRFDEGGPAVKARGLRHGSTPTHGDRDTHYNVERGEMRVLGQAGVSVVFDRLDRLRFHVGTVRPSIRSWVLVPTFF